MPIIISPTGEHLRMDGAGHGYYGAPRGSRLHLGHDYPCTAGQNIVAPITGRISRIARPYSDDQTYFGCEIVGKRCTVKLFYVLLTPGFVGREVSQGEIIGKAQSISKKYGPPMTDHVHLAVTQCDPTLLM
jgi:hypothetical protein